MNGASGILGQAGQHCRVHVGLGPIGRDAGRKNGRKDVIEHKKQQRGMYIGTEIDICRTHPAHQNPLSAHPTVRVRVPCIYLRYGHVCVLAKVLEGGDL